MINKNIGRFLSLAVECLLILSLFGSFIAAAESEASEDTITITDLEGIDVDIPSSAERVVVLPSGVARLAYSLDSVDKLVGIGQNCNYPTGLADKTNMGSWSSPSLEILMEQNPDLIIADGHLKIRDQIEATGVPLVVLGTASTDDYLYSLETLGLIFGKEDKANELSQMVIDCRDMIEERTQNLKDEDKVTVFYEWSKPYFSLSALSSGHETLEMAGGINIAAEEPVQCPLLSAEWLVEENPKVVIRSCYFKGDRTPSDSQERMEELRDEIIDRPGLSEVDAIKNDQVYVFNSELRSDFGNIVAVAYFAKWLYPDLFADVNIEAIHANFVNEFYGTELEGTWVL